MDFDFVAVALVPVIPVDDVDRAIGAVGHVEHLRPAVSGKQKVGRAVSREARAFGDELIDVDAVAVNVAHEELAVELRRPAEVGVLGDHEAFVIRMSREDIPFGSRTPFGSAEVDHRAGVSVAAAEFIAGEAVVLVPLVADVMPMPGDRLNVAVGERIESAHPPAADIARRE